MINDRVDVGEQIVIDQRPQANFIPWFSNAPDTGLRGETLAAWEQILDHGQFVGGDEVRSFERAFERWVGAPCAGVSSGTAALSLALRVCGVEPGDEVIVPALSFFATIEAVIQIGARPVLVDIDPNNGTLDVVLCAEAITNRTRAIVPVHLYGRLAAMGEILALAAKHGLVVVEDAAQSHGARISGRHAGTLGDAGAVSFHPTKNLPACGDAGAVVSRDVERVARVRSLRNHGQTEHQRHDEFGETARLDSLQAVALELRLRRLDGWNDRRAEIAKRYRERLVGSVEFLPPAPAGQDAHHLWVVRHPRRDELASELERRGVGTAVHYQTPLHQQPAVLQITPGLGPFPVAERWGRENLTLPLYPGLTGDEVDRVCEAVIEATRALRRRV